MPGGLDRKLTSLDPASSCDDPASDLVVTVGGCGRSWGNVERMQRSNGTWIQSAPRLGLPLPCGASMIFQFPNTCRRQNRQNRQNLGVESHGWGVLGVLTVLGVIHYAEVRFARRTISEGLPPWFDSFPTFITTRSGNLRARSWISWELYPLFLVRFRTVSLPPFF